MRKLWSILLTAAALGSLVALWALPASAYYPPLQATYTPSSAGVQYHVWDPKLQKDIYGGTLYDPGCFVELQWDKGVAGWVLKGTFFTPDHPWYNKYFVYNVVYDPGKAQFVENLQGPFDSASPLTVKDGVVAYLAVPSTGQPEVRFATYDPSKGDWQQGSSWPGKTGHGSADWSFLSFVLGGGVVLYKFSDIGPTENFLATIYDPIRRQWAQELYVGTSTYFISITIGNDTTIHIEIYMTGGSIKEQFGYDTASFGFVEGQTAKPLPWFWPQPDPLWVWFTDMSIGGTSWSWDFGDGTYNDRQRSPHHVYPHAGRFQVTQIINGGAATYIKAVSAGLGPQAIMMLLLRD